MGNETKQRVDNATCKEILMRTAGYNLLYNKTKIFYRNNDLNFGKKNSTNIKTYGFIMSVLRNS